MTTQQYCTFTLGNLLFGVEVERVHEAIQYQRLTPVPQASPVVRGLINLRGHIVTAIDLRRCLDFDDFPEGFEPMSVVIRTSDEPVGLMVDSIGDIIEVSQDEYEAPPNTLAGIASELITGAYKLEDRLLLVLDAEKTMALASGSLANVH